MKRLYSLADNHQLPTRTITEHFYIQRSDPKHPAATGRCISKESAGPRDECGGNTPNEWSTFLRYRTTHSEGHYDTPVHYVVTDVLRLGILRRLQMEATIRPLTAMILVANSNAFTIN